MKIEVLRELWGFISNNPLALAQTALSFALVAATVVYTIHTRGQTSEMKRTRERSNQPVVRGGVDVMTPTNLSITVKNTGNGAAHDVSTEMFFPDIEGEMEMFKIPILEPGEEFEFGFPLPAENEFVTSYDQIESLIEDHESDGILVVESECENVFGEDYSYRDEIDVLDVRDNLSHIIMDDERQKVRKALEGIEGALGDLADGTNQEYQDELSHQRVYRNVRDVIRDEGQIGFKDLKYRSGVKQTGVLERLIRRMEQAGLVTYPSDKDLRFHDNVEIVWLGDSVADVNENEIGGASGQQIMEEIEERRSRQEDSDEPSEARSDTKEDTEKEAE